MGIESAPMPIVRNAQSVDEFAGAPGDPDGYAESIRSLWASGESGPESCFLLGDGSGMVGRIGFRVTPPVSEPGRLGSLAPLEISAFGFHLPWNGDHRSAGAHLLSEALAMMSARSHGPVEVRINNSVHPHPDERRTVLEENGFELFQEKVGFSWTDDGTTGQPDGRLTFRSVDEIGDQVYQSVLARCGGDTLDRNDRHYWAGCGPENWAAQMMEYLEDEDRSMWLVGFDGDEPVGHIAVMSVDDWGSTIAHIGVLPEHRGRGHVDRLLRAGADRVRAAGISTMLSDVDVLNEPMRAAMRRVGHREDPDRWHVWAYRTVI